MVLFNDTKQAGYSSRTWTIILLLCFVFIWNTTNLLDDMNKFEI